jgi:hypothetical protein
LGPYHLDLVAAIASYCNRTALEDGNSQLYSLNNKVFGPSFRET